MLKYSKIHYGSKSTFCVRIQIDNKTNERYLTFTFQNNRFMSLFPIDVVVHVFTKKKNFLSDRRRVCVSVPSRLYAPGGEARPPPSIQTLNIILKA